MTKPNVGITPSLPATDLGNTAAWDSKRINSQPQLYLYLPVCPFQQQCRVTCFNQTVLHLNF